MQTIADNDSLRRQVHDWRQAGERIAFVPTMGNLHQGHVTLVERAKSLAPRCVVSIFVNPLQFGAGEDFDKYPRTLEADSEKLQRAGVDVLYVPAVDTLYPHGQQTQTRVLVPGISDILCGASRPGHFEGVATVVAKLFNLVQPDLAVFGQKDFQQMMVIRRMVSDLCMPVEIVGEPTVREADGLAMSSRNGYLAPHERARAPALYRVLNEVADGLRRGAAIAALERVGTESLQEAGFGPDYLSVRRAEDLALPGQGDTELVILGAAYLGRARLIDNLSVNI